MIYVEYPPVSTRFEKKKLGLLALEFLQVGGGVGNTLFPLMDRDPLLRGYLCDFSATAIEHV